MASGERRLVFDTRGKRKHVVRVVYAILALLMGGSLFLVVGPFNLAEILGTQSSSSNAAVVFDEQAERIERRLAKNPEDEQMLLSLTRARISAGNAQIEPGSESGTPTAAREDFLAAKQAWRRYLKQADEPSASVAQLVAGSLFALAESGSITFEEIGSNLDEAAAAQQVAAKQQPSLGSISTLAIYEFYAGDFAAGDKATKQAAASAPTKAEAKNIEKQLDEYRKQAKTYTKQSEKVEKQLQKSGSGQPQNPLFEGIAPPGSTLGE